MKCLLFVALFLFGLCVFISEIFLMKEGNLRDHKINLYLCIVATIICGFIQDMILWPDSFDFSSYGRFIGSLLGTSMVMGCFYWITIVLCVIAIIMYKYKLKKNKKEILQMDCEKSKIRALEELENGNIDKLTWANALIAAGGDEIKAKAEYLKNRSFK